MYFNYGMNMDDELFPECDAFKPDRFLDEDGLFQRDERNVFFGLGKRRCPGELLARAELFLFLASLMQQFRLLPASGQTKEDLSMEAVPGLVFYADPYDFQVEERSGVSFVKRS